MKIAIIGGGAAGLLTAWLLDGCYETVLFEKQPVLGGHAQTVHIPLNDRTIPVDLGVEFFTPKLFPHFFRLLNHLAIATKEFPLTSTLYTSDKKTTLIFPHMSNSSSLIKLFLPNQLMAIMRFLYFVRQGSWITAQKNKQITIQEFIDSLGFSESFKNNILYPILSSGWGTTINNFKLFSAYDILTWIKEELGGFWPASWFEISGGVSNYIDALAKQLTTTIVKTSSSIQNIVYENSLYKITQTDGSISTFDHLILATEPQEASILLKEMPHAASFKAVFDQIESFQSIVAIHGDSSVMPENRSAWSVANICYDGKNSALTIYKHLKTNLPIFKTWVIQGPSTHNVLPNRVYALKHFQHQSTTPLYFTSQEQLKGLQGVNNMWVVGTHTYDIDSHESAVISALLVAKQLAPNSRRITLLNH
jgi:uncharacterized protein